MTFKWPDQMGIENRPFTLLANELPMKEIYRLKFDVFVRTVEAPHRLLFYGTDGGAASYERCGGKLPAIYMKPVMDEHKFLVRVCSCIGDNIKCKETPSHRYPSSNTWVNIQIEQNKRSNGKYYFQLKIDGSHALTMNISGTPLTFDNVSFFLGKCFKRESIEHQ